MHDYPPSPISGAMQAQQALGMMNTQAMNPTLRENIDGKIQWHQDEIERLKTIKEKLPTLLDVNLRDLREAMNF